MAEKMSVADYLTKAIEISGKTQREIALEVGYDKPNVVSMMKQGQTKVPIDKAPLFAKACGVDPAHFMRLVLAEYFPESWRAIRDTLGEIVTEDEKKILDAVREAAPNGIRVDPIVESRVKAAIKESANA